jgi:hypothetical protein
MEEGQNRVAHELDDFSARLVDGGHDAVEVGIEQLKDAFARKAIRQVGEAPQAAEAGPLGRYETANIPQRDARPIHRRSSLKAVCAATAAHPAPVQI